jgi:hypothetical protein
MASRISPQALERSPKGVKRASALSPRWTAFLIGWFFAWPVSISTFLPLVTPGDTFEAWLLGAGSLPWLLSCYAFHDTQSALAEAYWPMATGFRKFLIGWFFGWFPMLIIFGHLAALIEHPYWIDLYLIVPGTILWLASCYGTYDTLLTIAQARWPAAKSIREIIRSLFRMLLASHGHHSS